MHILFAKNPILVRAIGLGPVISTTLSLKNGVAISLIMVVLTLGGTAFDILLASRIPDRFRLPAHMVLSTALLIPAYLMCNLLMQHSIAALGVFAPLMAVNSILSAIKGSKAESRRVFMSESLGNLAGFVGVVLLLSIVRELLTTGTLWGVQMQNSFRLSGARLPFICFIALGFCAALSKYIRILNKPADSRRTERG
jgi:Na+-translocating ferredoxin:NAD+ oxidoreductase RnfE subunit